MLRAHLSVCHLYFTILACMHIFTMYTSVSMLRIPGVSVGCVVLMLFFVWWQNCNLTWMCSCIIVKLVAAVDLFPPHWEAALANFQMKDYLVSFGLWFSEVWKWQINVPWKLPFVVVWWEDWGSQTVVAAAPTLESSSHWNVCPFPPPPPPPNPKGKVGSGQPASLHPAPPPPQVTPCLMVIPSLSHSHTICSTVTPSVPYLSQSLHQSHSHPISLTVTPSDLVTPSLSVIPSVPQSPHISQSPHLSISPSHPISISVTTISLSHPISPTVTPPLPKSPNLFHSHPISPTQTFHISPNHPSDSLTPSVSLTVTSYLPQPVHLSYSHSITQSLHLSRHPISHCHPISLSHSHSLSPTASPSVLQSLISTPPLSHSQLLSLSSLSTNSSLQSDTTLFRFVHYLLHTVCT